MSRGLALLEPEDCDYLDVWQGEPESGEQDTAELVEDRRIGDLASSWSAVDPVIELVADLRRLGRLAQARTIESLLGLSDTDETDIRSYVSALWTEDWDSPEDAVYDVL